MNCIPIYESPEMIEARFGNPVIVQRNTDVWSVGCVLVELKTFEKAFNFCTMATLRSMQVLHRPQDSINDAILGNLCNW